MHVFDVSQILIFRLKGGPFIKEMLEHWTFLIEKQTKIVNHILEKKAKLLYVYSGHDTTIATILNSLKVFNGLAPPYASAILLELLKREEGKHFVRIAYRNDTEVVPYLFIVWYHDCVLQIDHHHHNYYHQVAPFPLTLPGCDVLCPLEKFKQLTGSLVPDNWSEECSLTTSTKLLGSGLPFSLQLLPFVGLVICGLFLLLIITLLFSRFKSRAREVLVNSRSSGYERL